MIPKITAKGSSFKGAAAYYLHDKEASTTERIEWTETINIATHNPQTAWRVMAATAMDQDRLKQEAGVKNTGRKSTGPVLAYSLSWHPDEKAELTREQMIDAAKQSLKALGAEGRQAIIIAHNDEPHPHVHIIVNRVSPDDGRMLTSSKEKIALSKWAQEYETNRGRVFCERRVENNETREMLSEFTRAAKDRPRHIHDQEKGLTTSKYGEQVKEAERGKDASLAARGREQVARHKDQWTKLKTDHKARADAIKAKTKAAVIGVYRDVRDERKAVFNALRQRQWAELKMHKTREKRVVGKIANAMEAIKGMKGARAFESTRGFVSQAFNYLVSSGARTSRLTHRHKTEKEAMAKDARRPKHAEERLKTLRTSEREQLKKNLVKTGEARKTLIEKQNGERQELSTAWRTRNQERAQSWGSIREARAARQQASGRFAQSSNQNTQSRANAGKGDSDKGGRGGGNAR